MESGQITVYNIFNDDHKFEAFYENDFSQLNNVASLESEERKFESQFKIKVLGYLLGGGKNDPYPKLTVRENIVEFKIARERSVLDDQIQHTQPNRLENYRK